MKYLPLILLLAACTPDIPKEDFVKVVSQPLPRPQLNLPAVDEYRARPVEWMVLTEANSAEVFQQLKQDGKPATLFAVDETGYVNISLNSVESLKTIMQQQAVINGYRKYYIQADGVIYEYNQYIGNQDYWQRTHANGQPIQ